jgi:hypothetical protein
MPLVRLRPAVSEQDFAMSRERDQLAFFDVDNAARPVLSNANHQEATPVADDPAPNSDPAEAIAQVRRTASAVLTRVKPLASVKGKGGGAVASLERAIEALGDPATVADALAAAVTQAKDIVDAANNRRAAAFGAAMSEYLRGLGSNSRETAVGWRVGLLELEKRSEDGSLRACYNRAVVVDWAPIREASDVGEFVQRAEELLRKAEVPEDRLGPVFSDAFRHASQQAKDGRVVLRDFLSELRVALVRDALQGKRRADARSALDLPPAALLYNTDRYRAMSSRLPADERLRFETGGQRETQRIGVVLNGLDPARHYESYCYVRRGAA